MRRGVMKPDGVRVLELKCSFINPPSGGLTAKAAFVDSKTGHTHGFTEHMVWSPDTLLKLRALRDAMELDLQAAHFTDPEESPIASVKKEDGGGLADHLSDGDSTRKEADQV